MFLSDHGKFSIINPKLINSNNKRKRFIIKQYLIRYYNECLRLTSGDIQQISTKERYNGALTLEIYSTFYHNNHGNYNYIAVHGVTAIFFT